MNKLRRSLRFTMMVTAVFGTVMAGAVVAQNNFDLDILDPGEIMLNLSASRSQEVEQDILHASLYYSTQGRDRVALQNEVNQVMTEVLEMLEEGDLEYSTQQYSVFNIRPGRPSRDDIENPLWQARQGVQLTSRDSVALLDIAGQLQAMGLTMSGLYYSLSPERHEEVSDSLLQAALNELLDRAQTVADSLGMSGASLIEISLSGDNNFYRGQVSMAARAEMAEMATPAAEPGLSTVTLSVSGRAILSP